MLPLQDIAILTGGTVISEDLGHKLDAVSHNPPRNVIDQESYILHSTPWTVSP